MTDSFHNYEMSLFGVYGEVDDSSCFLCRVEMSQRLLSEQLVLIFQSQCELVQYFSRKTPDYFQINLDYCWDEWSAAAAHFSGIVETVGKMLTGL